MKISTNYWKDNADDKNDRRADWVADARRHAVRNQTDAAAKQKQIESLQKEETKFIGVLESAAKPQKTKPTPEDTGEQRREDEKKDKKNAAREKDSTDNRMNGDRIERNQTSYGGQFGGGGFGGDGISQTIHLSENFAARSILHIADLERMISAIRSQSKPGGKREVTLKLNRSVLEGLQVKITTDAAAQVQIEFLVANESVRSQIENHSEELANILRGRGVNLQSLTMSLDFSSQNDSPTAKNVENEAFSPIERFLNQSPANASTAENTFADEAENETKSYRA